MLLKTCISICFLERPARKALHFCDRVFGANKEILTVTGISGVESFSFQPPTRNLKEIIQKIKSYLGKEFRILSGANRIYIAYNPR